MSKQFKMQDLSRIIQEVAQTEVEIDEDTDVSQFIQDSIDLGEVVARVKEVYGIEPSDMNLFRDTISLREVYEVFIQEN